MDQFLGSIPESEAWLCVLEEGRVNAEFVDKEMLREALEAGAAQLGTEFDFDQWAQKSGYA
jgi:acyl CoA:acetate/3-ketoacid CoA transferase alpha subunit